MAGCGGMGVCVRGGGRGGGEKGEVGWRVAWFPPRFGGGVHMISFSPAWVTDCRPVSSTRDLVSGTLVTLVP